MPTLRFGGSFNPIHHGHLICARSVAEAMGYDRVELIPAGQPPHKPGDLNLASGSDRLTMCSIAAPTGALFTVNDIEISSTGPSYTIDTARKLSRADGNPVHWLIGADMLLFLPKWHCPLDLLNEVTFVVMARPSWDLDWNLLPREYRQLQANVVKTPLIDISASGIRHRVAHGLSIEYLTPEPVCRYIREHGLYQ